MVKTCLWLLYICFFFCLAVGGSNKIRKQTVTAFEKCDNPSADYDVDNYVNHTITIIKDRGHTYLSFNYTIKKKTPASEVGFRAYGLRNGEKKKEVDMDKLTCRHPLVADVLKKMKLMYDSANCTAKPGTYASRINMDFFSRYYQYIIRGHSSYILEVEFKNPKGVMACVSITLAFPGN